MQTKTYGTVTHMPPELLLDGKLSKSADVYAYGVLLYELFTAERAWGGLRHAEVLQKVAVMKEKLRLPEDTPQLFKVMVYVRLSPGFLGNLHEVGIHEFVPKCGIPV